MPVSATSFSMPTAHLSFHYEMQQLLLLLKTIVQTKVSRDLEGKNFTGSLKTIRTLSNLMLKLKKKISTKMKVKSTELKTKG